jgi:hypothetical protein
LRVYKGGASVAARRLVPLYYLKDVLNILNGVEFLCLVLCLCLTDRVPKVTGRFGREFYPVFSYGSFAIGVPPWLAGILA